MGPQHNTHLALLEQAARRDAKMVRELEHLSYKERLREPGLFILGGEKAPGRRSRGPPVLRRGYSKGREALFIRVCSDMTSVNSFKLEESRFRLDVRKKFFTLSMVSLPRRVVDAHPRKCSRPAWMGLWASRSTGKNACPWQRGWNSMILNIPSNPKHSVIR